LVWYRSHLNVVVMATACALAASDAAYSCTAQNQLSSRVCYAAKRMQIPLHTLPIQTDGRDAVMARFKKIGDLNASNVRAFVGDHPENTEYLITYLEGLDGHYLESQQRILLANAALHELLVVSNYQFELSEDEPNTDVLQYENYKIVEKGVMGITPVSMARSRGSIGENNENRDTENSSKPQNRTFVFDFSVGYAHGSATEPFYVGSQVLNSYTEEVTQPYVAIKTGLFLDESIGLGLKFYDSFQNNFTVPANPTLNLGPMQVYRDWKGGVSPFIFYDWRPSWSSISGYLEYGQLKQKLDYRLTGTAAGIPYDGSGTSDITSHNVFLGLGYKLFDSWLVRLTHQWSKVRVDNQDVTATGYGLEVQSDF
jgi:hypothetical protein